MKIAKFVEEKIIMRVENLKTWIRVLILAVCTAAEFLSMRILIGSIVIAIPRPALLAVMILGGLLTWTILMTFLPEKKLKGMLPSSLLGKKPQEQNYVRGKILLIAAVLSVIVLVIGVIELSMESVQVWLDEIASRYRPGR